MKGSGKLLKCKSLIKNKTSNNLSSEINFY